MKEKKMQRNHNMRKDEPFKLYFVFLKKIIIMK